MVRFVVDLFEFVVQLVKQTNPQTIDPMELKHLQCCNALKHDAWKISLLLMGAPVTEKLSHRNQGFKG